MNNNLQQAALGAQQMAASIHNAYKDLVDSGNEIAAMLLLDELEKAVRFEQRLTALAGVMK